MADGALQYALSLSTTKFTGPLASATGGLVKFTATAAAVAAPLAVATAGAGALAFALQSVKAAGRMETLEVGMANILGTRSAARSLLAELDEFSNATPFTLMDDFGPVARLFLNAGVAAGDMKDELLALGNVAAIAGKAPMEVASIYAKALTAGVSGEVLQQFREGLVPIDTILSNFLGVPKEKLMELASTGQISADQLRAAFQQAAGAGGQWGQAMSDMAQTYEGKLSTLKGKVDSVKAAFGAPLIDAISPVLDGVIAKVDEFRPKIIAIGQAAGQAITRFYTAASNGRLGELVRAELTFAGMKFVNWLSASAPKSFGFLDGLGMMLGEGLHAAGKFLEGALLDAAGAFLSRFGAGLIEPVAWALEKLGRHGDAFALRMGVAGLAAGGFGGDADAARDQGRSMMQKLREGMGNMLKGEDFFSQGDLYDAENRVQSLRNQIDELSTANRTATETAEEAGKAMAKGFQPVMPATPAGSTAPGPLTQATNIVTGDFNPNGAGGDPAPSRGRIRLFDREASERRRYDRLSDVDQRKFGSFEAFQKGEVKSSLDYLRKDRITDIGQSDLLGKGAKQMGDAVRNSINPATRALGSGKKAETGNGEKQLLSVMQQIEENTRAFADVAVA